MARAAYMRTYRKDHRARIEQRAFIAGFQTLQADLVRVFQRIGRAEMNGLTALEIVRNSKPDVPRANQR